MADLLNQRDLEIGARRVRLTLPELAPRVIIYTHGDAEEATAYAAAATAGAAVAAISGIDWDADLSPWPAPRAFARGEDFSGGAPAWLEELTGVIVPAVERELPEPPEARAIAGYSLAGLFALYAGWNSALFSRVASMSGSLWFDGFVDYLRRSAPAGGLERCYLSLGSGESATKNARMAAVGRCTEEVRDLLASLHVPVRLETHPGGHFRDVPMRVEKGLLALV